MPSVWTGFKKTGTYPKCNIVMHKKCGVCELEIEFCTCTGIITAGKYLKQKITDWPSFRESVQ